MKAIITLVFEVEEDFDTDDLTETQIRKAVERFEKKYFQMSVDDLQKFGVEEDRQVEIEE